MSIASGLRQHALEAYNARVAAQEGDRTAALRKDAALLYTLVCSTFEGVAIPICEFRSVWVKNLEALIMATDRHEQMAFDARALGLSDGVIVRRDDTLYYCLCSEEAATTDFHEGSYWILDRPIRDLVNMGALLASEAPEAETSA